MSEEPDGLYAVIPAGGSGTRLWPFSRAGHPKFLHPLTGTDASLLQATVHRLEPLPGGGTRVTYRTEITGPAAEQVGPELGPAITADFPDVLAKLVAHAEALTP